MLIFALVLAVLALVQVSAVPAANQQIEYEHSQRIEGDLQQLDTAIDRAAFDGTRTTTSLELGTRYPTRLFLLNPPPVSGVVRTSPSQVQLSGFNAVNEETRHYLQGTLPFETRSLTYRANYNEYASAPDISYEGGILYERYDEDAGGEAILADRGALVSGRRITLITLDASLSSQLVDDLSLDAVPVSASPGTVSVQSTGGATITVETSLSEETWKTEILETEYDPDGSRPNRYVSGIECTSERDDDEPCDGELAITFEAGTYNLRMAKVGLGSGFGEEPARYLTTAAGDGSSIADSQAQKLTVEVRDQYNNPVSGETVTFTAVSGGSVSEPQVTSDEGGRASVTFTPDEVTETTDRTVQATIPGGGQERRIEFTVEVSPAGGDPGTGEPDRLQDINPRNQDVEIESARLVTPDTVEVTFRNTDEGNDRQFRHGRIPFVLATGGQPTGEPDSATLSDGTTTYGLLLVTDQLKTLQSSSGSYITVPAGGTKTVQFAFDSVFEQSTGEGNFDAFFVFSTTITDTAGGNGQTQTFFISDELGIEPFSEVSASDPDRNQPATTQTFTFTPRYDMEEGQTVSVDLDPAQNVSGGSPSPVDYRNASVAMGSTLGGGNATVTASMNDAGLTYTIGSGGLSAGQQVTVQIEDVATQPSRSSPIDITFSWSYSGSEVTSFRVG